ncbi:unnamed protein product [Cochlearia groenlandica]
MASCEEEEKVLISLEIEDDKLFLLHFIIGTYFGPHLPNNNQSAFQIQSSKSPKSDKLIGSLIKRAKLERVYHYILNNTDPSLTIKRRTLTRYFNGKRSNTSGDFPLFADLYPSKRHPQTRRGSRFKFVKSIVFINDPDTSCMKEDCVKRFKRLTGLKSFTLSLNIDETDDEVSKEDTCNGNDGTCTSDEEVSVVAIPGFAVNGSIAKGQDGPTMGLMDIGQCADAYLFRVSLPGVKRDERDFSCELEDNGKVVVRGVTTTGEKRVNRYSQVFEMQTQNLCPSGHFSVSFSLPGPVHPQEFSGNFGPDGIFEGIVMKKLQKQTA